MVDLIKNMLPGEFGFIDAACVNKSKKEFSVNENVLFFNEYEKGFLKVHCNSFGAYSVQFWEIEANAWSILGVVPFRPYVLLIEK